MSLAEGRRLADEGGQRALSHADVQNMSWGQRAERALRIYCHTQKGKVITIEKFRPWAYSRGLPEPPAPGAFGPIVKAAARNGLIKDEGFQPSDNATQHGKPVKLWRVL